MLRSSSAVKTFAKRISKLLGDNLGAGANGPRPASVIVRIRRRPSAESGHRFASPHRTDLRSARPRSCPTTS